MPDDKKVPTIRGDGAAPYPLGGDILVRAIRGLTMMQGVGVDQANRQTNQFGLDSQVGFQASLLDVSVAPFRSNGRSLRAAPIAPAGGAGTASFSALINPNNSGIIVVADQIEVTLSVAAGWSVGYALNTSALIAAAITAVASTVDPEASAFPTRPPVNLFTGFGAFGIAFDPAWNPFAMGQGVAANSPPIILALGDVCIYPGLSLVLISSVANVGINSNWRARIWKMGQATAQQTFG